MKPIFPEEQSFFERKLGIKLPNECWRHNSSIYLNLDKDTLLLKYSIVGHEISIKTNKMKKTLSKYDKVSWQDEIEKNKDRLLQLENESIQQTIDYIKKINHLNKISLHFNKKKEKRCCIDNQFTIFDYMDIDYDEITLSKEQLRISISGGKDSTIMHLITLKAFDALGIKDYTVDFFNTSNDTAETYKFIKGIEGINIVNPKTGFYNWIKQEKDYFIPSVLVRNCCDEFKESKISTILDDNQRYILFLGLRKYESFKRSHYDYDINESVLNAKKKLNVKPHWHRFAPIVEWTDEDIWLYILMNNIEINKMYYKGFNRVGCLICPNQQQIVDLLIKEYYPKQWNRWEDILTVNYKNTGVEKRLKWTLSEWLSGKWKAGTSKEYDILKLKPTDENVKKLADLKGVSMEVAREFFTCHCKECNKVVNPTEIAMSFKSFGAHREQVLCKVCYCNHFGMTKKHYTQLCIHYRNSDCQLF